MKNSNLNLKKPFTRKKCVNILIIINNKRFSFVYIAKNKIVTKIKIFITFIIKIFNLKFIIKSRIIIKSFLKFNKLNFFKFKQ